jgi:aerotaxis receptor
MRNNGPVTHNEYRLPPDCSLVSTTDLKGRILYCNSAFVAASGFEREELLGQPHNLIRHPDMPAEAFRDLWDTISSGRPWSMLVKNRRKNGDHYWVRANVTPLMKGDEVVAYMSVRTVPERAEIEAAEALYARLRQEEASGGPLRFAVCGGRLVRQGLPGRIDALAALAGANRLALLPLVAAATAAFIASGAGLGWGLAAAVPLAWLAFRAQAWAQRRPLQAMLRFARRMAACDLTQPIDTRAPGLVGELALALAQLNVNLRTVVGDVRGEVHHVSGAVSDIASGSQDMASRTESQASSLQETAASLEEITGAVRQNADSARASADLASQAVAHAQQSQSAFEGVHRKMDEINGSSERIASITQVIDAISFQTNLLALNAAVEAARAGEHGRGFGVVAGEVRALAARTMDASREIKGLVQAAQAQIDAGVAEVDELRGSLGHTCRHAEQAHELAVGIRVASDEQLRAISQISEALASLDGITQQNAAMVEELSAATMALSGRAHVLRDAVQVFRVDEAPSETVDAVALRRQAAAAAPVSRFGTPRPLRPAGQPAPAGSRQRRQTARPAPSSAA